MAYTPENNPYIPGDPYSYDLKWIVEELKTALALYQPLHDEFTALDVSFDELHDYVMNYFAQLDLTQEVSDKLDQMAADGSLDAIVSPLLTPIFDAYRAELDEDITAQNAAIAVLESRMDTFASLPDGSTAGDAELTDIRVGASGYIYPTAGDAVRDQVSGMFRALAPLPIFTTLQDGYYKGADGTYISNVEFACTTEKLAVQNIIDVSISNPTYEFFLSFYDTSENYIGYSAWSSDRVTIKNNTAFFNISIRNVTHTTINANQYPVIRNAISVNAWTDNTLGIKYKAADAGAVDIALSQINNMMRNRITTIPFYSVPNAYINAEGEMAPGYLYSATNYIRISAFETVEFKRIALTGASPLIYSCTFYDDNYNVISNVRAVGSQAERGYLPGFYKSRVPINAKYARFSLFQDSEQYGDFELFGLSRPLTSNKATTAFTTTDDQPLITSFNDVIAAFDTLRASHPDYMASRARQSENVTLYEYILTTGNYNDNTGRRGRNPIINKPKILILSGLHGDERASVAALYKFTKALCNKEFPLSHIINGAEIHIIPVAAPNAFDAATHLNSNGVNLNRNFDTSNWHRTEPGYSYSGAAPADQEETQIIQEWIQENSDARLYIDWHNSNYVNEVSCFLGTSTDEEAVKLKHEYLTALNEIIPYWQLARDITPDDNIYGYTGGGNPGTEPASGTSALYAIERGIECAYTMETSWNINGSGQNSNFTIATSAEIAANVIRGFSFLKEI